MFALGMDNWYFFSIKVNKCGRIGQQSALLKFKDNEIEETQPQPAVLL
jgi:hypothetical protein